MDEEKIKEMEKEIDIDGYILTVEDKMEGDNFERIIIERDVQRQIEERRITDAKYNKECGKITAEKKTLKYLEIGNLDKCDNGKGIVALAKVRCGNMENEY